jgi:hypothetical protein
VRVLPQGAATSVEPLRYRPRTMKRVRFIGGFGLMRYRGAPCAREVPSRPEGWKAEGRLVVGRCGW